LPPWTTEPPPPELLTTPPDCPWITRDGGVWGAGGAVGGELGPGDETAGAIAVGVVAGDAG